MNIGKLRIIRYIGGSCPAVRRGFEEAVFVSGVQCLENGFPRIQKGAVPIRSCGLYRRENAGMSSERKVIILPAEYLRFPE